MPDGASGRTAAALRALGLACLAALTALQLRAALRFLVSAVAAIGYPFGLDYGEGPLLSQTHLLASWQSIYRPIDAPPYAISNYPPVFQALTGLLDLCVHDTLAAGRCLSVASTLLTAVVIAAVVWRAIGAGLDPIRRGLAAAAGGLGLLGVWYTARWAPLMRVDMLAGVFAWTGVLLFVAGAPAERYRCAVPFLLALYTKQTAVAAPAACLLVALCVKPRYGLRLAAIIAGSGLAVFVALDALTGGWFAFHLITANHNAYSWQQTEAYLWDIKEHYLIEVILAVAGAASLIRRPRPIRGGAGLVRRGAAEVEWARPVLAVFLITAFLVALTVGKVGAYVNYLIEFMAVAWACVAVTVGDALTESRHTRQLGPSLVAFLLPALLVVPIPASAHWPAPDRLVLPAAHERREIRGLVQMVRGAGGPVLSQDVSLPVLAGKAVEFQPFEMTQLVYQGLWDQGRLVARLAAGDYRLVILTSDVRHPADLQQLTPQMVAAISAHYALAARAAQYWVYAPRRP